MNKSKIEKRLPKPQHSKEQKADVTSVSPAIAKPHVVRSPNDITLSDKFIKKLQDSQLPLSEKLLSDVSQPCEFLIGITPINQY